MVDDDTLYLTTQYRLYKATKLMFIKHESGQVTTSLL